MRKLRYVLHVGVLVGLVWAGTKFINGAEFWAAIHRFEWTYLPYVLACTLTYFALKAARFSYLLRRVNRARTGVLLRAYLAGQAYTVLPGGVAARAGLLKQAGIPVEQSGAAVALSSLSDGLALLFGALISALWFDAARKPALVFLSALILVSVLLGVQATRTWLLTLVERLMGRFGVLEKWRGFVESVRDILSFRTVLVSLAFTLASLLIIVLALELCLEGVGARVSYGTDWLAVTLPGLLGRVSAMPAGVGVTEAGMVSILDAAPGVRVDQAAAGVTMYRVWTVLFECVLGAAVYLLAWRGRAEGRRPDRKLGVPRRA